MSTPPTPNVVHVIQLAVAPVFLLSGVGTVLIVLTGRLARIIDRARLLEDRLHDEPGDRRDEMEREMKLLSTRARMVNYGLTFATTSALFVCLVIALLFIGSAAKVDFEVVISVLFVGAMLTLTGSLAIFMREIHQGTQQLRFRRPPR